MSIRPFVLMLACVAVPALAAPPKYEKVGEGGGGVVSVWVDKESIRRSGSQVQATIEWRWKEPTNVPDKATRQYRLERQTQISNCENRGYAVSEGTRYADDRGTDPVDSYKYDEALLPYTVAVPRTVRDFVVTYVCAYTPPKKP